MAEEPSLKRSRDDDGAPDVHARSAFSRLLRLKAAG